MEQSVGTTASLGAGSGHDEQLNRGMWSVIDERLKGKGEYSYKETGQNVKQSAFVVYNVC